MRSHQRPALSGDDGYVRALGPQLGVALYGPIVAVAMRERTFRGRLGAQILADAPPGDSLEVVLHHLPDPVKLATLRKAHRLLRPGGRVHVADWGSPRDP